VESGPPLFETPLFSRLVAFRNHIQGAHRYEQAIQMEALQPGKAERILLG